MKKRIKWILLIGFLILLGASASVNGQSLEGTVELQVPQGTLKGTLVLPETATPCPVVLIIAGSGPTDRNGNNHNGLNANYLKMLADDLAQIQVADAQSLQRANPKAKLVLIDGMNHVLKSVPDDVQANIAAYGDSTQPLAAQLVSVVADFIEKIK